MTDEKNELVKSQAALDQAWASMEPLLAKIVEIGEQGIKSDISQSDIGLVLMCVKMVGWECSQRVLQREQYIRAFVTNNTFDNTEYAVRIESKDGPLSFFVPKDKVSFDDVSVAEQSISECKPTEGKIRVRAYRLVLGYFAVSLPTWSNDMVIVPGSEIE